MIIMNKKTNISGSVDNVSRMSLLGGKNGV